MSVRFPRPLCSTWYLLQATDASSVMLKKRTVERPSTLDAACKSTAPSVVAVTRGALLDSASKPFYVRQLQSEIIAYASSLSRSSSGRLPAALLVQQANAPACFYEAVRLLLEALVA